MQITNSYTNHLQGFTGNKIEYSESSKSFDNNAISMENAKSNEIATTQCMLRRISQEILLVFAAEQTLFMPFQLNQ